MIRYICEGSQWVTPRFLDRFGQCYSVTLYIFCNTDTDKDWGIKDKVYLCMLNRVGKKPLPTCNPSM